MFNILLSIDKIDINNNTDIIELTNNIPLSNEKLIDISEYIYYYGNIDEIYELLNINSITSEDIKILKKYIYISNDASENTLRSNLSYKIDRWVASEGNSEGISEIWLDKYYDQQNINDMNFDDLSFLPNVSPMDVAAIIKQQNRGAINGTFQLKNSPGISHYGYKNVLDFIVFEDVNINKVASVRYTTMARTVPSYSGLNEDEIPIDFIDKNNPETLNKLLINPNNYLKFGFLKHNNLGDPKDVDNIKYFVAFEKIKLSKTNPWLRIDNIILGNFNARFGQGVIFESGDSYRPRRTGYGFSKRETGITYDLTRSSQFVLSGYAIQLSSRQFRLSLFYSDGFLSGNNKRDAVINEDGSFSTFINMTPRLGYGYTNNLDKIHENMINSVEERTIGGNIRFSVDESFNFGFTIYESMYDRVLDPQILESVVGGEDDILDDDFEPQNDWDEYSGDGVFEIGYMSNSADPEIRAMYGNSGTSNLWDEAKSFRRVYGMEFNKVIGKMSVQGEYGRLDTGSENNPDAFVINTFLNFDTFNFLILYRDYDLAYDNPYQRSFSEYRRYKSTIFEDSYWLEDPIFYNLYSSNSQPQAEKGYYIESRYQFHEDLVAGIQWDSWIRKADEAQYSRIVTKLEWRPLFNYRIYFRYKLQSRGSLNIAHPSPYFTKEARVRYKIRLSNYDNIEFMYSWNYTAFSPRPRLTGDSNPFTGNMSQGDTGKPEGSIGFSFEHNFNKYFKMKAGVVYADGFLWYIEDNDFRLFDTDQGICHSWIAFNVKPNNMLSIKLKMSHSSDFPATTIVSAQTSEIYWINNPYVYNNNMNFKIQIDYAL